MAWTAARRQAQLEFQAAELRRSQEQNIRGAIIAERMRIARDLHDVVAHHVSVMGIQAGAARRVLDSDPVLARDALQTVEKTARTAISELRGLLGVLRADAESDLQAGAGPGRPAGAVRQPPARPASRSRTASTVRPRDQCRRPWRCRRTGWCRRR